MIQLNRSSSLNPLSGEAALPMRNTSLTRWARHCRLNPLSGEAALSSYIWFKDEIPMAERSQSPERGSGSVEPNTPARKHWITTRGLNPLSGEAALSSEIDWRTVATVTGASQSPERGSGSLKRMVVFFYARAGNSSQSPERGSGSVARRPSQAGRHVQGFSIP